MSYLIPISDVSSGNSKDLQCRIDISSVSSKIIQILHQQYNLVLKTPITT